MASTFYDDLFLYVVEWKKGRQVVIFGDGGEADGGVRQIKMKIEMEMKVMMWVSGWWWSDCF